MRTPFRLAVAALAAGVGAASGTATATAGLAEERPSCEPPAEVSSVGFGVRLLTAASESGTRNALVSPLGVGAVLEMLAPGAKPPVRRSIREMFEPRDAGPGRAGAGAGTDATASAGGDAAPARPARMGTAMSSREAAASFGDEPDPPSDGGSSRSLAGQYLDMMPRGLSCQLAWVLHDARGDGMVSVQAANGAFADRRLDLFPAYSAVLRDLFEARVERLDFKDERSVDRINAWVEEETGGAVPHLVSELDPDDVLVLANAMRFEGEWAQRFDPERTVPAPFHLRSGAAPEVPTMHAEELAARYREDEGFQAVALPYGGGRFELVAVLPRAGLEAPEALRRLAADPSWLDGRGFRRARGALALPRLSLGMEASLLPALRALGLGAAIDDPRAFAGIAAPAPKLSRVLQRTMLVLDERGTEAAAATAAVMTTRAAIPEEEGSFEMRVDRPFALAVRHRGAGGAGAVLFTAWVDDPSVGETR